MSTASTQLALDLDHPDLCELRRESREECVRIAEYSVYPRTSREHRRRTAVARNTSNSGLCLGLENRVDPGALLHVVVRGVDGVPILDAIARVVWCQPDREDHFRVGVSLVTRGAPRMLLVRHSQRSDEIPVTA